MKKNGNIMNVLKVTVSNFSLLLAGVATSFVLPKFLTVYDFGLYKVFNLYTTYIILLQFGISEAVYLIYGGKSKNDISKPHFYQCFKLMIVLELIISSTIIVASIIFLKDDYRFIFIMLAIDVLAINITNLFQYLSQAIQKFSELSIRNVLKSLFIVFAVLIVTLVCSRKVETIPLYKVYIILIVGINILLMFWYIYSYRDLLVEPITVKWKDSIKLIKYGFPLCLANIISSLILAMDRQVVSLLFNTEDYAKYAFAYSLLTLAITVVTSVAVVVFPMLKKSGKEKLSKDYVDNVSLIIMVVCLMAAVYYPMCKFINIFLPDYIFALSIFRIIIPGMIISSPISIVMHNYYKTFDLNLEFLKRSIVVLVISILANFVAYRICGTMESISYASVIVMFFWYLYEEQKLHSLFVFNTTIPVVYMICMCLLFYMTSLINNWIIGLSVYLFFYGLLTMIMQKKSVDKMVLVLKSRGKRR